ncbi:MAG TPA: hypothetical protein VMF08_21605 [Candidatus Sulfotelmatobacter sp.]|nr:hypothetical protein [Candidatus Sulfotelmatobacter sp.]
MVVLIAIFATPLSSLADPPSLQELESRLFDCPIIWQATNTLPKSFWTYEKALPCIFNPKVITNAIILASFESKGYPKPSTNDICIFTDPDCDSCGCARVCNFSINPGRATLSFNSAYRNNLTQGMPGDDAIIKWASDDAPALGVDPKQIAFKNFTSHYNTDTNGDNIFSQISGRGVYLCRRLEGIFFWGDGDNVSLEGFWIEFGSYGQIRAFTLTWPDLKRVKKEKTATPEEIIRCIAEHKTIILPKYDEPDFFGRLKTLATARKLTITKITPYYSEGHFGDTPTNSEPKIVMPVAELAAVADVGNSNMPVQIYSPIISSDAARLVR